MVKGLVIIIGDGEAASRRLTGENEYGNILGVTPKTTL
jgi:hypothetical protein